MRRTFIITAIVAVAATVPLLAAGSAAAQKSQSGGGDAVARIQAVPDGGSEAWDDVVKAIVIEAFDADGSGMVDSAGELAAIGCDVWAAMHSGIQQEYPTGLLGAYGFDVHNPAELEFLGMLLGISAAQGGAAYDALVDCGMAAGPKVASGGRPAQRIAAVPDGGSDAWDVSVKAILLSAFDADGSGSLDTVDEVAAVACDAWRALHNGIQQEYPSGLLGAYGFDAHNAELQFLGPLLGLAEGAQEVAYDVLVDCGIASGPKVLGVVATDAGEADAPAYQPLDDDPVAAAIRSVPYGGTPDWDFAVMPLLVDAFDADGSGSVDGEAEVGAVSCAVWQALDDGVREIYETGLVGAYGIDIVEPDVAGMTSDDMFRLYKSFQFNETDSSQTKVTYVGDLLGFDSWQKGNVYDAIVACGVH